MRAAESVDVVIVGSGPIGSAYARTIHDLAPAARILQLEAGPLIADPPGRHVKTIVSDAEREAAQIASQGPDQFAYVGGVSSTSRASDDAPVVARTGTFLLGATSRVSGEDGMPAAAMSENVGGMGSHWTCACPPPAFDERIPFIPEEEFDELFAEASRLLHVSQSAFDDAPLGAEVRDLLGAQVNAGRRPDRLVQPMPLGISVDDDGVRYWTGTDVVLGDLVESSQRTYELRPNSAVRHVHLDDGHAIGVRVLDRVVGEEYDVATRYVVVAADSLRTPQLLHASGIRPRALGHYLNDHPQVIGIVQLDDRFVPEGKRRPTPPGAVPVQSGVSWIPYHGEKFPYHGQIMQMDASPVPVSGLRETWPGSIVGIGFFCPKEIRFEDRLEFSASETDHLGLPQITVHYQLTDQDHRTLAEARARISELGEAIGEFVGGRPPLVMPAGSSMHYMGTVRMGTHDDGQSVCDPYSRVWGVDNLFVGGNGVIPTATAGNPTATSVALAVRAARLIADDLVGASK